MSTEDWQDPVTSRARQREQAEILVRGRGHIVGEFFDVGESRTVAWARRPQAAAPVAQLADPDRGWDAVVIEEYERVAAHDFTDATPRAPRLGGIMARPPRAPYRAPGQ